MMTDERSAEIRTRTGDGVLGWWIWMLDAAKVGMSQDFHRYEKLWTWIYERITRRDRELRAENARNAYLRGAIDADDERLRVHSERVGLFMGCDTVEHMADEIAALRAELAAHKDVLSHYMHCLTPQEYNEAWKRAAELLEPKSYRKVANSIETKPSESDDDSRS